MLFLCALGSHIDIFAKWRISFQERKGTKHFILNYKNNDKCQICMTRSILFFAFQNYLSHKIYVLIIILVKDVSYETLIGHMKNLVRVLSYLKSIVASKIHVDNP